MNAPHPSHARQEPLIEVAGLVHAYGNREQSAVALRGVDLEVARGERVAMTGRSGSGKTTLINILAGLRAPTRGRVVVAGWDLSTLSRSQREAYRRRVVGLVWQDPGVGLLPRLTVLQNVLAPMLGERGPGRAQVRSAMWLLEALALGGRAGDQLSQLTSVEIRRLAVCTALANRPQLLLVDELTAGLDAVAGQTLVRDVETLLAAGRTSALIVAHHRWVRRYVDRVVRIHDGLALEVLDEPPPARDLGLAL